jgi:hypothetical protein
VILRAIQQRTVVNVGAALQVKKKVADCKKWILSGFD